MPKINPNTSKELAELSKSSCVGVFELLHTGIALMSAEGNFLYCNKAFTEMYNLPADIKGKHVSDFFLTAEEGVMNTIRTRKLTICSSLTTTNAQGISFRYPILNNGRLLGVLIESIAAALGKDKLKPLLETIQDLEKKSNYLEQKSRSKHGMLYTFDSIIGTSASIGELKKMGARFAKCKEPILLFGESGTGKELVAQALHSAGNRADKPFITVNCAALPHELMEAELFGYESGAFTGAKSGGIKGKFEMANGGTIFLDEIGELPLPMQAKLLRVLESGEIQKLAHSGRLYSDFRLIAATNRNLSQCVAAGTFREDLYHRLNILELSIPPLRERKSDIMLLAKHFIELHVGAKRAREIQTANELVRLFARHPWSGNIRELKNVLTYALYNLDDDETLLTSRHLPERFFKELRSERPIEDEPEPVRTAQKLEDASADAERKALTAALINTKYNKTLTARVLGISRNKLYRKMRELGLLSSSEKE